LLEVGRIPNADEIYGEEINQAMMERLSGLMQQVEKRRLA